MAAIIKNILMLIVTGATLFEVLACHYSTTTSYYLSRRWLRKLFLLRIFEIKRQKQEVKEGFGFDQAGVRIKCLGSVHNAHVFSNSAINHMLIDGKKVIIEGEREVPICLLGNPAYQLFHF